MNSQCYAAAKTVCRNASVPPSVCPYPYSRSPLESSEQRKNAEESEVIPDRLNVIWSGKVKRGVDNPPLFCLMGAAAAHLTGHKKK